MTTGVSTRQVQIIGRSFDRVAADARNGGRMMLLHLAHGFLKWLFTLLAVGSFANMCKQMAIPYAPRTIVRGGQRIRKGTLDNVLDGAGAVWGFCMIAGLAAALWLM
jgi:hypothetical protein